MISNINIAVFISGGGTNLAALIEGQDKNVFKGKIKLVLSNKKSAYGLVRAQNAGIKNIVEKDNEKILKILQDEDIDLIVLAGYLKILPDFIIKNFENRIINIHPSLIPSFCGDGFYGIKVHEKVVESGVKLTGATTHFVTAETDMGPIIMQEAVKVNFEDSPEVLQKRVLEVEHRILVESVRLFCQGSLRVIENRVKIER